jgi:transposase
VEKDSLFFVKASPLSGFAAEKIYSDNRSATLTTCVYQRALLSLQISEWSRITDIGPLASRLSLRNYPIRRGAGSMTGFTLPAAAFLSTRATDMRKSIDGLCGEVREYLGCEPMDGHLFVFYNRCRDKLKFLFWDRDGYWVMYKRLEAGTFQMPAIPEGADRIVLGNEQLQLILYGIDLDSVRHRKRFRLAS